MGVIGAPGTNNGIVLHHIGPLQPIAFLKKVSALYLAVQALESKLYLHELKILESLQYLSSKNSNHVVRMTHYLKQLSKPTSSSLSARMFLIPIHSVLLMAYPFVQLVHGKNLSFA